MILSNLNSQSKTITGAALILATATLASRFVGLLRDRILAHYFGAGEIMDAYYAAFKIPDLVYTLLIVGALTAGFIPIFTRLYDQNKNRNEAWYLANNIFNITGIVLMALCILGAIFASYLTPLIAPGFSEENTALAASFTRIMFFSPFLLGLSMTLGGILQSLRRFVLYSIAPIFYNLGIIFGAAVLSKIMGPTGLAWGVVIGALAHLALMKIGAINSGWRWKPIFNLKDKDTRLVGKLMLPRTVGAAISEINILITTMLASLLTVGSVAVYNFAANIQAVPTGIIGIPFALAVFPILSVMAARNDLKSFATNLSSTIRKILFLIIPFSLALLLLRAQVVRVILGSGEFDWTATITTADALAFFSLGLFAQSLIPLLARAFYSLSDTKTPLITGILTEIIAIGSAVFFMRSMGAAGLALACSIGAVLNMTLLITLLRRKLPTLESDKIINSLLRISVAAILMALVVQFLKYPLAKIFDLDYFWGVLGQGFFAGIAGLLVYTVVCWLLKVPEFIDLKESLARRWFRVKNVEPTDTIDSVE